MSPSDNQRISGLGHRITIVLRTRFSLVADNADDADIDKSLRAGIEIKGTSLWVLMFAIFIASIGLNVNSTAVIIGAMLISPLMGPIMGVGYGAGIYDFDLIRTSLKNLGIATLIGLLTSALYFWISPLTMVQSELLARTTPTIWDVLIALFGGLAGIVAVTRKDKSTTVIPGVAIATALMPPLCTAGFGLATANWHFFLGAFYLFTINCVFIALSSFIIIRVFNVAHKRFTNAQVAVRMHRYLFVAAVLTITPSIFLAYQLVGEEIYKSKATQFVRNQSEFKQSQVVAINVDPKSKRIEVSLVGDVVPQNALADMANRLSSEGLTGSELKVFQAGDQKNDVAALKSDLLGDLYKQSQGALEKKNKTIDQLRSEINLLKASQQRFKDIPDELHALYPQIDNVLLSEAPEWNIKIGWNSRGIIMLSVHSSKPLSKVDQFKIEHWVRTRLKSDSVRLVVEKG